MKIRCPWASGNSLFESYHDSEWGVPLHDEHELFGFLMLEGAQAGLSWQTILNKRDNYRAAFAGFDPRAIAEFTPVQIEDLLTNSGIVRNRQKILSAIKNAKKYLEIEAEFGSFDSYQWQFVGGRPKQNDWKILAEVPVSTPEANAFSSDLVKRGFSFVGAKIIYAHMQATGMVNDHLVSCFRHDEVARL